MYDSEILLAAIIKKWKTLFNLVTRKGKWAERIPVWFRFVHVKSLNPAHQGRITSDTVFKHNWETRPDPV
jgi:hypothetical protein